MIIQVGQLVHPEVGVDEALSPGGYQEVDVVAVLLILAAALLGDEEESLPVLELHCAAEEEVRVDLPLEEVVGAEDGGAVVGLQPLHVEGGVQPLVVEVEGLDVRLEANTRVSHFMIGKYASQQIQYLHMTECLPKVLSDVELLLGVLEVMNEEQLVVGLVELDEFRDELEVVRGEGRPAVRRREDVLVKGVCTNWTFWKGY